MERNLFNWKEEKERIENNSTDGEFFKAEPGRYNIKFLAEPVFKDMDDKFNPGQMITKAFFDVEIDGKVYVWSVRKSGSAKSLYYQIVDFASARDGLVNHTMELVVKGTGKDKSYTVL